MEEKIFINKTSIREKEHKELNKVIFNSKILPMIIVYQIMALLFTIYGIVVRKYTIAITFGVLLVLFPVVMIFISRIRTEKIYQKYQEIYNNSKYTFTFTESGVKIELAYNKNKNSGFFNYSNLKVIETKESIFLFISASNAYVVSKEGFESNYDPLGFRSVVQGKVKKYKIKK